MQNILKRHLLHLKVTHKCYFTLTETKKRGNVFFLKPLEPGNGSRDLWLAVAFNACVMNDFLLFTCQRIIVGTACFVCLTNKPCLRCNSLFMPVYISRRYMYSFDENAICQVWLPEVYGN